MGSHGSSPNVCQPHRGWTMGSHRSSPDVCQLLMVFRPRPPSPPLRRGGRCVSQGSGPRLERLAAGRPQQPCRSRAGCPSPKPKVRAVFRPPRRCRHPVGQQPSGTRGRVCAGSVHRAQSADAPGGGHRHCLRWCRCRLMGTRREGQCVGVRPQAPISRSHGPSRTCGQMLPKCSHRRNSLPHATTGRHSRSTAPLLADRWLPARRPRRPSNFDFMREVFIHLADIRLGILVTPAL